MWCWKLIRDRLGEMLAKDKRAIIKRVEDDELYERLLRLKVLEESLELLEASDPLEEAADILEVLLTLLKLHGYTLRDLLAKAEHKRREKGGFEKRLIAFFADC